MHGVSDQARNDGIELSNGKNLMTGYNVPDSLFKKDYDLGGAASQHRQGKAFLDPHFTASRMTPIKRARGIRVSDF